MDVGPDAGRRNGASHTGRVRAAEYVRMSTEHQKYSTENQSDAIRQYAGQRGMEIVRTYADEGKTVSGWTDATRLSGSSMTSKPGVRILTPSLSMT
jgi:hypothetical protein